MKPARRDQGLGSLELIEEAVHLLRTAPLTALACYYAGALPFVLGALYFWADMSRSPFAGQHLTEAALGLAVLFLWMKFWQAIFLRSLRAWRVGESRPLGWRRGWRIAVVQTALQPTGLFLLPLALIPVLPFSWLFAFYQNLTALADGESAGLRPAVRAAMRQAARWPAQNHLLLLILSAFGLFVYLNCATVCYLLPGLAKMLFGVESVFARSGLSLLNTTFFAAMFGLTYLCVDPVVKVVYALRCFYGESRESGADLKAELRKFAWGRRSAIGLLVVWLALTGTCQAVRPGEETASTREASSLRAESAPKAPSPGLSAAELDRAIQDVMQQRKYAWRMPREKKIVEPEGSEKGILRRFWERVLGLVVGWLKKLGGWLDALLRRLFARQRPASASSSGYGWILLLNILVYVLVAAAVAGLAFLAHRVWQRRRGRAAALVGEPIQPVPDLEDEHLSADQLADDEWTRLGRELLARGELRLALRAFYLASLASLAGRNLITLAKFKSNRDYERELCRRGHAFPSLLALFDEAVGVFDRTWYGCHATNGEAVNDFAAKIERIRAGE